MKVFVKDCFSALIKEISKAILAPLGPWVAGLVALALPTLFLWWQAGFGFLKNDHATPGWLLALITSILLFMAFFIGRQRITISRLEPSKDTNFLWGGLEWILTEEFRRNFRHTLARDMGDGFLGACIRGPFCPSCQRDVSMMLKGTSDACIFCNEKFDLGNFEEIYRADSSDPLIQLRKLVYIEAQAAARRNEL